jgi:hypothetical protein
VLLDGGPAGPAGSSATITAPALPLILSTYVVVTAAGLKPPPSFHKGKKSILVYGQFAAAVLSLGALKSKLSVCHPLPL